MRTTPPDDPDHTGFLFTAGQAQYTADPSGGVAEAWRAAARSRTGLAADMRLRAAWAWGDTAATAGDAADAAAGFATAVALLPVLAWRGLDRAVREQHLWRWSGLASDACAWTLRVGDPRRAVELLEQGRSITWNQVVQTRADLTAARTAAPELVARLDELRAALDAPAPVTDLDAPTVLDRERIVQAQRRLAEEWDEIVDRIRGIDGLETFLAAVPYEQLAAEAARGPIVVINLSRYGCCAIALTKNAPVVVDLPALTRAATAERANALRQTRLTPERERTLATVRAANHALLDTLAWLYDTVAAPVADLRRCGFCCVLVMPAGSG